MLLPHQRNAQSFALPGGLFQHAGFDHCSGPVSLADGRVECNLSVEGGPRANHAVSSEHPGLDKLARAEAHDQRNDWANLSKTAQRSPVATRRGSAIASLSRRCPRVRYRRYANVLVEIEIAMN